MFASRAPGPELRSPPRALPQPPSATCPGLSLYGVSPYETLFWGSLWLDSSFLPRLLDCLESEDLIGPQRRAQRLAGSWARRLCPEGKQVTF